MFWFDYWPFFKLRKKLTLWADRGAYPSQDRMPKKIRFSRRIWRTIKEINKNTAADGSERAVSVLDIDSLLILTPAIIGESEKVLLKHKFKVQYQYEKQTQRCYREIYRDDRLIIKDYFITKKPPAKINLRMLFNIHTHPSGDKANFFSPTDIQSLISNQNIPAMVLVAANIWLLLKSSKTHSDYPLKSNNPIKQCQEAGLVIYKGKIGEKLRRVN
jgi:hypothetical protein